jgi:hypothetical protein
MEKELYHSIAPIFGDKDKDQHVAFAKILFIQSRLHFDQTSAKESTVRFHELLRPLSVDIMVFLSTYKPASSFDVIAWNAKLGSKLADIYQETKREYFESGSAEEVLGRTKIIYSFIRNTLKVPLHKGDQRDPETWGAKISRVYRSLETGTMTPALLAAMHKDKPEVTKIRSKM